MKPSKRPAKGKTTKTEQEKWKCGVFLNPNFAFCACPN